MGCSGDQKVTVMVLKVDLQCSDCYKKVKKTLCRFPQIRNQVYDEKNNTVTITVVCCSPEKIRDKLCSKGGKSIQSIEIKPDAKKPEDKPKPAPAPAPEKPKQAPPPAAEPEKPKPKPAPEPAPAPAPAEKIQKNGSKNGSKKEAPAPAPAAEPPKAKPAEAAPPAPAPSKPEVQWVPGFPPQGPPPQQVQAMCCTPCYQGIPGGPCYQQGQGYGYGYGYAPGPGYGYSSYGRPPCPPGYSYNNNGRCDYFSEENPAGCWIM